jgi:hypothetical protein
VALGDHHSALGGGRVHRLGGGIGMGMVFVPLFDIAMPGIRPHEMGSASGVLQTVNSLSMSTGVAGLGRRPGPSPRANRSGAIRPS